MYSNRHLYYLHQLGISPLVTKNKGLGVGPKPCSVEKKEVQLIILARHKFNDKAQLLVQRMMHYLTLAKEDYLLLDTTDRDLTQHTLKQTKAHALLALGLQEEELLKTKTKDYPVLHTVAMEQVLAHPLNKKKIWAVLHELKGVLSAGFYS